MMDATEIENAIQCIARCMGISTGYEFVAEFLDGDDFIVNCVVKDDASTAEGYASDLAEIATLMLNKLYPRVAKGECWHCHSEPNYWSKDAVGGESFEVDFDDLAEGDVVQFQIYESQI